MNTTFEPYAAYFAVNTRKFVAAIGEHLVLCAVSLLIACTLGALLGIVCAYKKSLNLAITGLFSAVRIIPSLAILFLCLPLMGVGLKPTITALSFLALPPILINTVIAITSIPEALIEAARAMGMNVPQVFFKVKAPLALPLFLTGFKTAAVEVCASATLAAYIGGGGLGAVIFTGLGLMRTELLVIGGLSVALLSLFIDFFLTMLEKKVNISLFGNASRH